MGLQGGDGGRGKEGVPHVAGNAVASDDDCVGAHINEVFLPTAHEAQGVESKLKLWRSAWKPQPAIRFVWRGLLARGNEEVGRGRAYEAGRDGLELALPLELASQDALRLDRLLERVVPPPLRFDVPHVVQVTLVLLVVQLQPRVHPDDLAFPYLPHEDVLESWMQRQMGKVGRDRGGTSRPRPRRDGCQHSRRLRAGQSQDGIWGDIPLESLVTSLRYNLQHTQGHASQRRPCADANGRTACMGAAHLNHRLSRRTLNDDVDVTSFFSLK